MKEDIVLALDPSTKATGWSIFKNGELADYGCITASSSNLFNRIDKIINELKEVIEKYNPNKVVLESVIPADVRHNDNVFSALKYLQGYILHTLNDYKITDYEFYTSSEWRSRCGIKTGAGVKRESLKLKDIAFVKKNYNINVNDDIADSICINYAYSHGTNTNISYTIDGFEFR